MEPDESTDLYVTACGRGHVTGRIRSLDSPAVSIVPDESASSLPSHVTSCIGLLYRPVVASDDAASCLLAVYIAGCGGPSYRSAVTPH